MIPLSSPSFYVVYASTMSLLLSDMLNIDLADKTYKIGSINVHNLVLLDLFSLNHNRFDSV